MLKTLSLAAVLFLAACDEVHQVSRSGAGAYEASLAALPDGFAAAWYDDRDGNPEIYFRLLDSQGRPYGAEHRLTNDAEFSYEADIAVVDGNIVIAWYERLMNGNLRAKLGMWTPAGEQRWVKTVSASGRDGRNTLVRTNGKELFCAWIEDVGGDAAEVWAGWWTGDGNPLTAPRRLAAAGRTTWNLNAAIDRQGRAWVVFDAKAGTRADELFLARSDKSTSDLVRLSADDGMASKYPDLALFEDRAALTWFDERDGNKEVYLLVSDSNSLRQDLEASALRVTNTLGESIGAYTAWNGDRVGLAWCDNSPGQQEIYFRDFDAKGLPLNAARRITHTATQSLIPAIKPSADGFALLWNEYKPRGAGHTSGGRSEILFALTHR